VVLTAGHRGSLLPGKQSGGHLGSVEPYPHSNSVVVSIFLVVDGCRGDVGLGQRGSLFPG
jgi:hypothetical protein